MSELSLENRLAIYELIAEYSHQVDNNRGQDWADLFTMDGQLVGPDILLQGPEAFVKQSRALQRGPTEYRHSITNIYLDRSSNNEQAVANAYGLVSDWATQPATLCIFVEYRFTVVHQGSGWKIAELRVNMPYENQY